MAGIATNGTPGPDEQQSTTEERAVSSHVTVPETAVLAVLGSADENLRVAEELLAADVHVRGNAVTLSGAPADVAFAERVFAELSTLAGRGEPIKPDTVRRAVSMLSAGVAESPAEVLSLNIVSRRGRTIRPKTLNQKHYVDAIDKNTIVFGIGPAGTGKTYLAMAKAVQALQSKQVNRIILTRPAVEAGERLGYLPGSLYEKIDPYLRPLYDALHDMIDPDSVPRLTQAGTIEVAPLAYMRGRAQPVDATVLTPDGEQAIGQLRVGDLVIGSDGTPTPVLGVHPQGRRPVYRLTAQDGASTECCGEHLWTVDVAADESHQPRQRRTLRTDQMIANLRTEGTDRYELPMVAAVQLPHREVATDPYAVGQLLGAGVSMAVSVTDTQPNEQSSGVGVGGAVALASTVQLAWRGEGDEERRNPVGSAVPESYRYNDVETRLALLQGVLDSAGVLTQRDGRPRIQFETSSPQLRDDVIWLTRSLGGVAIDQGAQDQGATDSATVSLDVPRHVVDIVLPQALPAFRSTGKLDVHRSLTAADPRRVIRSIEPVGEADTVCISVGAADSLYVTDDFLLTHNTLNDAFIILDEAQNTTPEQMKMFLTRLGFGSQVVVTGDVTQVDLPGGQRSGLRVVRDILDGVDDVHFCELTSVDVVRHKLVGDIVEAYDRWQAVHENENSHNEQGRGRRR